MKSFEIPEIQMIKFEMEDVITTSNSEDDLGDNNTPPAVRP